MGMIVLGGGESDLDGNDCPGWWRVCPGWE